MSEVKAMDLNLEFTATSDGSDNAVTPPQGPLVVILPSKATAR